MCLIKRSHGFVLGRALRSASTLIHQHAAALEPLLRAGERLRAEAAEPLPPDLEDWLPAGARDFAAIAEQMAPQYAKQRLSARGRASKRGAAGLQQHADMLDQALARTRAGELIEASLAAHPDSCRRACSHCCAPARR